MSEASSETIEDPATTWRRDIFVCLFRVVIVFPLTGAVLGMYAGWISVIKEPEFWWFWAVDHGVLFGTVIGFFFSLPVVWSLRRKSYRSIVRFMGLGTAAGASFGLIGNPTIAWLAGMFGFWIGYLYLLASNEQTILNPKPPQRSSR